jgi:5-methylcytosine-specific restriction protein A
MNLQAAFTRLLAEYPTAVSEGFAGHDIANFLRQTFPEILEPHIADLRYVIEGSPGKGRWVRVPWVGIFDTLITDSAQSGFYVVYLVKEDFSGFYLTLNQGVTDVRDRYGADAKQSLRARDDDFAARLGKIPSGFSAGSIDLAVDSSSSLGAFYEVGAICSRYYPRESIPDEAKLLEELLALLVAYQVLVDRELPPPSSMEREDDEDFFEDPSKLRVHKRVERNKRLSKKVKEIQGYTCRACSFKYIDKYQGLDTNFIEAHHLIPLAELAGEKVRMDPKKDFVVLCANCHRMIHRSEHIADVESFRLNHIFLK